MSQVRAGWLSARALLLGMLALLSGCAAVVERPQDPMIGQILDMRSGEALDREALMARIQGAEVIYLGERHDNSEHHQRQLEVLEAMVAAGLKPVLGFEVFDLVQTSLLMRYSLPKARGNHGAAGPFTAENWLQKQIDWEDEDDNWRFYGPLLMAAREHRLPTFGADLPKILRARITAVGYQGLSALERRLTFPSGFADSGYERMMRQTFKASHCGWGSEAYLGRLYDNWVARNDAMAMAINEMRQQYPDRPVLMVLGTGHVRYGRAVAEQVARLRPGTRQLAIGLQEVHADHGIEDYLAADQFEGQVLPPAFDLLWLTSAEQRGEDPCKRFLKHKKAHQPEAKSESGVKPAAKSG